MLDVKINNEFPPGFKLRHTLLGHKKTINQIIYSQNGQMLFSSADDYVGIWDIKTGELCRKLKEPYVYSIALSSKGHSLVSGGIFNLGLWNVEDGKRYQRLISTTPAPTFSVAWSPDGEMLASGSQSEAENLLLWDAKTGQLLHTFKGHSDNVRSIVWSPDGSVLASGSDDQTIVLWDAKTRQYLQKFIGHSSYVLCVAWSPDGSILASTSSDQTIRLWDPKLGRQIGILEGHTDAITCVSFSFDGRLLASKSRDGSVCLWRSDTRERVAILNEPSSGSYRSSVAFHPNAPILATLGEKDKSIRIWDLDFAAILGATQVAPSLHYTNAKVVLVGDNSVGKSGLGLVLSGQHFIPTDSTHGRNVWTFDSQD